MSDSEIHDLTENDRDDGKVVVSALNLHRPDYKLPGSSGSDSRIRIPIPVKRRQLGQDDYPNFERQYIQNINIPTATRTESENDVAVQNQDDNYHFLMSLLPYLREVPKNRKMVIRHKLQRVFVEEQERKYFGRNTNANNYNINHFPPPFTRAFMPDRPQHNLQQVPRHPPPPYPGCKQNVGYNSYVPSATSASMPSQNARATSTCTSLSNFIVQQPILQQFPAAPVSLPSGHQPLNFTYNANVKNNNFSNYSATASVTSKANNNFSNYSATASVTSKANNNFSNYSATATVTSNANANANANTNANNNNFSNYNSAAAAEVNSNATAEVDNDSFSNYNSTAVDSNASTYQSSVTGEPQTITYLQ